MAAQLEVALTIDDAPSIAAEGPIAFDAARMDAVREALVAAGVKRCVAFVIGRHARGHERSLERWLAQGYELGNHSEDHARASSGELARFVASVEQCDALLRGVGAFDQGRARYFRFPFGDRGAQPAAREARLRACADLGYTIADVSIDLFDWCYEAPLATAANDPGRARRIEARHVASAAATLQRAGRLARRRFTGGAGHIAALHFGLVSARALPALLAQLAADVRWGGLEDAVGAGAYARFHADPRANGILAEQLRAPVERPLRRLAQLARRAGWFDQSALGPRWPYLAG
jgi:peptidoglycan/xylan/chitin deacetylase (PgdA/CDA1 family)